MTLNFDHPLSKMKMVISDAEYETRFKPFIQLRILTCENTDCGNIFALTESEILQLVVKDLSNYRVILSGHLIVKCPLCQTEQALLAKDIIGDYLGVSTI